VTVDFWFDPVCPYSWIGSRWLLEVERYRPVRLRWHVMSLYLLNADRTDDPSYVDHLRRSTGVARVATAVEVRHGGEALGAFYTAYGARVFDHWRYPDPEECRAAAGAALESLGLPGRLGAAFSSEAYDADLRRSHDDAVRRVGDEAGTPVLALDGAAAYGPVLGAIPRGRDAVRVFEGARLLAGHGEFYELKRTRERPPVFT
jgi:hypothetical protein